MHVMVLFLLGLPDMAFPFLSLRHIRKCLRDLAMGCEALALGEAGHGRIATECTGILRCVSQLSQTESGAVEVARGYNKALASQHFSCAPSHLGSRARRDRRSSWSHGRKQKGLSDSQQSPLCQEKGILPSQEGYF